jgi:hypothetical protein
VFIDRQSVMNNRCAQCHGKFGLVRHRRDFKPFCSKHCVDRYNLSRRIARTRKVWLDCLLVLALLNVPAIKPSR